MESPTARPRSSNFPSRVKVVLRLRPFLASEIEKNGSKPQRCISLLDQEDEEVTVHLKDQWTSRSECYKLDSFFGKEEKISQIFRKEVSTLIPGVFTGVNATVFAYGATGSGKTYTMQGAESEPGLITLAMSMILSIGESMSSSVEISFYEVYLDRCYDLLEPKAKEIMALDDQDGRVQLKGLSWVHVNSMDEFNKAFSTCVQRRKVAHTGLNDVSSRSHAVLSIAVRNSGVKGKLNLIDLAGNEDNRRTCNEGIRLQESAKINQSLFALSKVIYALNNNEKRIPYRESKLTRILQDSLGGRSCTLMIACLNPGSYQEAVHTVSLAARSRQIVNHTGSAKRKQTPKEKVDMEAKLRDWLESKGKTKSFNRMNGLCSPPFHKTPASLNCSKKLRPDQSSCKEQDDEKFYNSTKGRKLFGSGAQVLSCVKETSSHLVGNIQPDSSSNQNKQLETLKEDNCSNFPSFELEDLNSSQSIGTKDGILSEDLDQQKIAHDNHDYKSCANTNKFDKADVLPEKMIEWMRELRGSVRKVLSPIHSNMKPSNDRSPVKSVCLILLDSKTPRTPSSACGNNENQTSVPFDKFNALSSNLKESLVEEYISFLNVASKEELMHLKVISYIITKSFRTIFTVFAHIFLVIIIRV
ncbi:putative 125 kDa kinesin-related protein [Apostasia shenzhenica]|uniref:Kinesin-like protein n=1 Tax=Apostasia shenzhenica TaxID=1088818 RepID=A0A2I0B616_9ASPA|nr:putative 125 kDa kinesin-related protein [Apostasia shenzhenica]